MSNTTQTMKVAETILAQLGGGMFLAMTGAKNLVVAPDCGLKYLSRDVAFGKLKAMVAGAAILREEMAGRAGPVRMKSNS